MNKESANSLTARIVIGMIAGIGLGLLFKAMLPKDGDLIIPLGLFDFYVRGFFVDGIFEIGGQIFVTSLKMLVVPLVFVSLVCGTCSLTDTSKIGSIGGRAIGLYLITTAIAITIAIFAGLLVAPGEGVNMTSEVTFAAAEAPTLAQVIIGMFPSNPFDAFAKGNMLQVIVFALLFGIAVALAGEAGERISKQFEDLNEVIMRLVVILMNLAPYGVFCLMTTLFVKLDPSAFANLAAYFFTVLGVLILHALLTYPTLLKVLTGLNPIIFIKKMRTTAMFAFSTASSNATIPSTLNTTTKKLGVGNSIASFTVPMGATINMDGTAIMQGVATVFIAQVFNVDLTVTDFLMVIVTATLASIGTAGVPGVGLIMLAMVLAQVGLPVEGIGLIIGVDRLLDMVRTAVNVTGDSMVTVVVGKAEGQFNQDVYNSVDDTRGDRIDFHHLKDK
ncbi:dicarboxylate/amino acid:cation symporter [Thalassotalea sp. HSM 43]|uniref:dicarboxylate/amino acid:cation symporter n=1 Tax=Thalassotalea sp. HSM 43 TaxID=2552945 RepID=UPI001081F267|nr:dicarboxylate/amino acid:cation symporter [Thalassotalea sp. HSM 43]QBY03213.1 dicarboxylate/amino acid:cation symporter [Thalassotalea sp. HSM 43]